MGGSGTRHLRRRILLFVFAAMWVLVLLPGTAFGGRVYQGDDYSQEVNNRHNMVVCDYERDGNQAYSLYHTYSGGFFRWQNTSGAGSCARDSYRPSQIFDHKTCEDRKFRPDPCTKYYK